MEISSGELKDLLEWRDNQSVGYPPEVETIRMCQVMLCTQEALHCYALHDNLTDLKMEVFVCRKHISTRDMAGEGINETA